MNILFEITTKNLPLIRVVYIVKLLIEIIFIVVPIILVVMGSIDLFKIMINPNDTKNGASIIFKRMMYAVMIFFVMPIVNTVMSFASVSSVTESNIWQSSNKETVDMLLDLEEQENTAKRLANIEIKRQKEIERKKLEERQTQIERENILNSLSEEERNIQQKIYNSEDTYNNNINLLKEKQNKINDEYNKEKQSYNKFIRELQDKIKKENNKEKIKKTEKEIKKKEEEFKISTEIYRNKINEINIEIKNVENNYKEEAKTNAVKLEETKKNNPQTNSNIEGYNTIRDQIVAYAMQYLGGKYVWGGTTLGVGVDCSGFVQQVYKHFGINISRTTYTQVKEGTTVSYDKLQKGDLIWYSKNSTVHVAMYIGEGKIIHARSSKYGIRIDNAFYWTPMRGATFIND